ncbi:MAG: hydrogenase accessory protein HypB, partial [Bacteroidetes bacterium]|nr:hydrogenase accessory protein HypB [Bacteroidota bacterium]
MSIIKVERKVLEKNDELAARNRNVFRQNGTFVINMVSSPGSGKTSILERTIENLKDSLRITVIEGDVQTDL